MNFCAQWEDTEMNPDSQTGIDKSMQYDSIHFTGAGGVGMAALAHIALDMGIRVSGSDIVISENIKKLLSRGAEITIGHGQVPEGTSLLVYSSAVPDRDPERMQAAAAGIPQKRRGDFLNEIAMKFPVRIAVSGSHGKTGTSAMISHILQCAGRNPGYLVGGSVPGWEYPGSAGDGSILVTEVDESDASQSGFPATHAAVLNIDDDHSWALGGVEALEQSFISLCREAKYIVTWDSETTRRLFGQRTNTIIVNRTIAPHGMYGTCNRKNAAVAAAVCSLIGIAEQESLNALGSFPGVARRMTEHCISPDGTVVLVEDYAHHPTELEATMETLREKYPDRGICAVFQPHRLERVERYGECFAALLSKCEWTGIVETFGAWRQDGKKADTDSLLMKKITAPCEALSGTPEETAKRAVSAGRRHAPSAVVVIGAGDVSKCIPFAKKLLLDK